MPKIMWSHVWSGLKVWGSVFSVWLLWTTVEGSGVRVSGVELRFEFQDLECRVKGLGFRVKVVGSRVWDSGFCM